MQGVYLAINHSREANSLVAHATDTINPGMHSSAQAGAPQSITYALAGPISMDAASQHCPLHKGRT